uniref:Uncharacterized protein n=1 Tax=Myoviridae sp. ct7CH26 TaxID=2827604 RepID=A0A8S5RSI5_9CAUD|nr:MAG TPA: hypothetical protein [Myoviridae sp. ct7CH26]DAP78310.1 MAG TPA: hypothetical protein [Caudoviricetes sp.]
MSRGLNNCNRRRGARAEPACGLCRASRRKRLLQ